MTFSMGDMSDPGTLVVKTDIVAFYVGGMTPHVWSTVQVERQTARYRLPIWVYGNTNGTDGGTIDGTKCLAALRTFGVPNGSRVVIDMETAKDPAYVSAFDAVLNGAKFNTHYRVVDYGSADFVLANPNSGSGYWVADWTGSPHLFPGSWATQWQKADGAGNPNPWDISEVSTTAGLWNIEVPKVMSGMLVELPNGATKLLHSTDMVHWQ